MRNIFTRLLVVSLLLLTTATLSAQTIENGRVYRFVTPGNSNLALGLNDSNQPCGVTQLTADDADYYKQLWYVEVVGDVYRLVNLSTAKYLAGNTKSSVWSLNVGVDACNFEIHTSGNNVTFRSIAHQSVNDADYCYMHSASTRDNLIVGWNNSSAASLWSVSEVTIDEAELKTALGFIALEEGAVYRFENVENTGRALCSNGTNDVLAAEISADALTQQWLVTKQNGNFVLRNLVTGRYLCGHNTRSNSWTLTEEPNEFAAVKNSLRQYGHSDTHAFMHKDGSNNIVSWTVDGSTGSQWTAVRIDYPAEDLKAILDAHPTVAEVAAWATNFRSFFNDDACTTPFYATLELAKAAAEYSLLSADLQALVDEIYTKVLSDNWEEDNAVDEKDSWGSEYAKKFRVQMYEPYSIAGDITSWLGINAHANNDNPTGIYMPEAGTLYVMVEGTIKDGASLRIVDGGHNLRVTNATSGGYALQPGLNVINYTGTAGQLYICYNVDTYNPDGATTAEKFPHKLSEYPPLKIHIEGGAIAGYYNACGDFLAGKTYEGISYNEDLWKTITGASVDNDADWEYMETRANLNVIPLLAHRQILLFHLNDYTHEDGGVSNGMAYYLPDQLNVPATPYNNTKDWADYGMECHPSTGKINIMLEAWDRIMYSELATMGLVSQSTMAQMNNFYPRWKSDHTTKYEMYDYTEESPIDNKTYQEFCNGLDYSEYFNHHGVALGTESGYMYGGWDHCGYSITTYNGIVRDMANSAGSTWGPAHEIGHQHQAPLTLNGLTEVTNNLFSNIALWYKGMSTSRYNGDNGSLESVLNAYNTEGSDIYTNNIWALTHLYYRLWLYYHLAGNNTQFWPRLYELLRQQPMQKGYNVSGDESTLHFYKLACQAAGEDLTEFFRAHGYFSIMDDRLVGDYSNSVYEVSQEMIDEAIAEVKEMGYEENLAILFINDDDETAKYVQHDGTTAREIYGETTPDSDFGSVSDFINGNVSVETTYTATLNSDGTLTMSGGEGGVGFLVLNEDREIVSFSNKSTFAISDEAAYLLATGKASVVAVDTESTTTEAEVDVTAMRFALLQELIENAIALTQNTSESRVGFYKPSAVTNLQGYVTTAQGVIANGDLANLQAVYELLYAEYNAVVANEYSRVTFVPGSKYAIINVKSNDRILTYSDSNVTTVSGDADDYSSTDANQWYIERDGAYYIKNAGTSKYIQDVTDQNGVLYTVGDNKVNMNINEVALGCYTIATSNVPGRYMNMDGSNAASIITWGDAYSENSQWQFILLEADDTNTAKEELLELSKKTLALVNEVATVSYNEGSKISLQSSSSTAANYIWSNAAVSGNDVDKLIDGNKGTYFHSQWNNSTAPADGWGHHISVDLGTSSTLTSFKFKFTTRNASGLSNYPKTIEVYGSNVGGDDVANYTRLQVASGFATGAGVDNEAVVMGNGTAYRYLRFLVTDATGSNGGTNTGSDGMVFFHMSEFSIYPVTVSATVKSDYTSSVTEAAVLAAYNDAEQGKTVYNNTEATLNDINAKKTALGDGTAVGSYTTLLTQYNNVLSSVLNAKKEELLTLIGETNDLISTVGSVTINPPTENELLLQVDNASASYYLSTNSQESGVNRNIKNLLDGVTNEADDYFHTNWQTSVGADHHLLLDMGDGKSLGTFTFEYTTRNNSAGIDAPTSIVVEGSNDNSSFTTIATLTGLPTGQHKTYTSETLGTNQNKYRYVRFRVTGGAGNVGGYYYFAMSEFDVTEVTETEITVTNNSSVVEDDLLIDTYLATTKSQKLHDAATTVALLDAAIADLQVAYDKLDEAINNTTALKESLLELINDTQALYDEMAADGGTVNDYYSTSALTDENLSAASTEIAEATVVCNNPSATVNDISTAYNELNEVYTILEGIKANDYSGSREIIGTEITNAATLLAEVMTAAETPGDVPLQASAATAPYYIWSNKPADDSNGIEGGLIDKNDDGTAKTNTFFGTNWRNGNVEPYTHYLEVDLGSVKSIKELLFNYTTRDSYANQRPNGIKVLASNDKKIYKEVFSVTDGLPTGGTEKWELEEPLNFVGRYIRFAVSTEVGYFNMADFNLSIAETYTLDEFYTTSDIDASLIAALNVAVQQASAAKDCFVLEDDYNTALANLQNAYNALNAFKNAHVADVNDLEELATTTDGLVTEIATFTEEEKEITMQCTDENNPYYLYCNADGTATNGNGDNVGVAALVGDNATNDTHLHTTYGSNAQDDDLDHYLRLDMGEKEAMVSFKFRYRGRVNNNSNAPKTMVIEGSNDLNNFEEIATLTDLPVGDATVTYTTPTALGNGKAYRYIRFMVTATNNGAANNGHPFFVLSQFAVTACKTIKVSDGYVSPNLPLTTLVTANNEMVEANAIVDDTEHYLTETAYNAAIDELQAAYNQLLEAKGLVNLPVRLTTDAANPVLYNIYINRGNNNELTKALAYDVLSSAMVAVEDFTLGRKAQGWYFMKGTDADSAEDILIFPYWNSDAANTTLRLASNDISSGNSKVKAVDGSDDAYKQNWYITFVEGQTETGWSNLQIQDNTTLYFSNHGGVSKKMGFHDSASYGGSEFKFVLADFSRSEAYYQLYNLYADCGEAKVSGTAIGCYTESSVEAYNNAYNVAADKLAKVEAEDDEYNEARIALEEAYNALTRNMPVKDGFYKIRSAFKTEASADGYSYDGVVYADDKNDVYWAKDYDNTSARAIWYIEPVSGGYNIKNMHTGCSFTTLGWGGHSTLSTTPATFTIDVLDDATGILKLIAGQPMHAQESGNKIVGYPGGLNSASAWVIEEVAIDDVVANVKYSVTLGNNTVGEATAYSSLCLGYPVTLPAESESDVKAYIATDVNEDNVINLELVGGDGKTIPANTPVILKSDGGVTSVEASYSVDAVATVDGADNLLHGSNYTTYIKCLADDGINNVYNVYMLTRKNGIMAMRWMYENYQYVDGVYSKHPNASSDEGGYVQCPANKAYLKFDETATSNLSTEYYFGFFGGTTDIDKVNTGEENPLNGTVYDLQGRKIEEVTVPGFYIVNGKKMYIGSELLK
ncbi:MAG: discoidin domain-containing protein [Bacteroidaceae bacterium]|nr:discoidin domain-containing protein [Bacteroidaceae bacterium]